MSTSSTKNTANRRRFEFRFGQNERDSLVYDKLRKMKATTRSDLVKSLLYAYFDGKIDLPDSDEAKAKKVDPRETTAIGKLLGVNFKDLK